MDPGPVLEVRDLAKAFPGTIALDGVSLNVLPGEVHGVIGENGAGKSTLMKILAGALDRTSGIILVNGEPVELGSVHEAQGLGIVMVYQELENVPGLSVAENIFLGRLPRSRVPGLLDKQRLHREADALLHRYGLDLDCRAKLSSLSVTQQQFVEIIKAVTVQNARVIILDEPTSSLTVRETAKLFEIISRLRSEGISFLYISHRLDEIERIADRVTVLRDGKVQGTLSRSESSPQVLISLMLGHGIVAIEKVQASVRDTALEIRDLEIPGKVARFSTVLRYGEILGIAGLAGSGKDELVRSLFGLWPMRSGGIRIGDRRVRIRTPRHAHRLGLYYLPEERKVQSIFAPLSVMENISATWLVAGSSARLVPRRAERALAEDMRARMNVKTASVLEPIRNLSGGNQQKAMLARLLASKPRILVLNDPTRGVDVGSKEEIYGIIRELAAKGMAIILLSSEIQELEYLARRVIVLSRGEVCGEFEGEQVTTGNILACATRAVRADA